LPDLGVDRVGQSTYEEIAFDVIRKWVWNRRT
jgi:hypothetical protein